MQKREQHFVKIEEYKERFSKEPSDRLVGGHTVPKNIKSLPNLAVKQGPNGGWEFAKLSFPCWHLAL